MWLIGVKVHAWILQLQPSWHRCRVLYWTHVIHACRAADHAKNGQLCQLGWVEVLLSGVLCGHTFRSGVKSLLNIIGETMHFDEVPKGVVYMG